MAWEAAKATKNVKPDGTTYEIHEEGGDRWARVRFRTEDQAIVVTVGPELYVLDGWRNNRGGRRGGYTDLTMLPKPAG